MEISKLKKALREVRDICAQRQYCADCPLRCNNGCPTWDRDGEATEYPVNWSLDWPDDVKQGCWTSSMECSECGAHALYNAIDESVSSRFCPHCGAKMDTKEK